MIRLVPLNDTNLEEKYTADDLRKMTKPTLGSVAGKEFRRTDHKFWLPLSQEMIAMTGRLGIFSPKKLATLLTKSRTSWEAKLDKGAFAHAISLMKKDRLLVTNNYKKARALAGFFGVATNSVPRIALIELTEDQFKNVMNSPKYGFAQYKGELEAKIEIIGTPGEDISKFDILNTLTRLHDIDTASGTPDHWKSEESIVPVEVATSADSEPTSVEDKHPEEVTKGDDKPEEVVEPPATPSSTIIPSPEVPSHVTPDKTSRQLENGEYTMIEGNPFTQDGRSITRTGLTNPPFGEYTTPVPPQEWIDGCKDRRRERMDSPMYKEVIEATGSENFAELNRKTQDKLRDIVSKANPYMRIPEDKFHYVLQQGRFKSQHEVKSSKGLFDPARRRSVEQKVMGCAKKSVASDYPIYGYLAENPLNLDTTAARTVSQYGVTIVELDPRVRFRSTLTVGDSLNRTEGGYAPNITPSPVCNPSHLSTAIGDMRSIVNDWHSVDDIYEYPEIQIYGQVKVSDIKKVYFLKKCGYRRIDERDVKLLIPELDKLGIPWELVGEFEMDLDKDKEEVVAQGYTSKTYKKAIEDPTFLMTRDSSVGDKFMSELAAEIGKDKFEKGTLTKVMKELDSGSHKLVKGYHDKAHALALLDSKVFYEQGPEGTGIYVATGPHAEVMSQRRMGSDGVAIFGALDRSANIISISKLRDLAKEKMDELGDLSDLVGDLNKTREYQVSQMILTDMGRFGLMMGYDAIKLETDGYLLTNMSKVTVYSETMDNSELSVLS